MAMFSQRLITSLASRSIFRNTRRTLLTIALIASCLAALMFTDGIVRGYTKSMVDISTQTFLGEAQIHQQGYRRNSDVDLTINNTQQLLQQLSQDAKVDSFSPRVISGAMLSSSQNVSGGMVYGVIAEHEAKVSKLKQALIQGQYLSGNPQQVLLGSELAEILDVTLGDRIVITLSQAYDGDLSQELFRVSGIIRFNDRGMDSSVAFINYDQAKSIINVRGAHEIAIQLQGDAIVDDRNDPFWQKYNHNDRELLSWKALFPQINGMLEMSSYSTLITSLIMYILVSLGLINTMFMSIFERHNEFGILLAIGTRPKRLFAQILCEGFFIGVIGMICGLLLGYIVCQAGAHYGINFGDAVELSGITINEPIYLIINYLEFIKLSLALLLVTMLACIYPALHASKLSPSLAMRKPL
ncbi:ABC transporter permease [Thalassotalea litorea]|uniref:ABC transporter permease n=1 Tax=Thalassotalea litorea TaxID=2020715 RepID=A0A5R9IT58_9GAMM|nr:FtsX-like permease family protein [Thalassotalea litorea]TLU66376.1 ABC transporter permease [Thalassotalea litorea]